MKNPDQLVITDEPIQNPSKSSSDLHQSSEGIAGEPRTFREVKLVYLRIRTLTKCFNWFSLYSVKNCFQQQQDQVICSIREELQEFARFVDDTVYHQGESST